ncbi:MAG: sigma 54-interacting transcriptional regulator [Polyangiaceae bacterium]
MDSTVRSAEVIEVTGGTLVVLSPATGGPIGDPVAVVVEPVIVGRGEHCQLVLDDPQVSDSHCSFTATPKGVLMRDLGSKNGTYLHPLLVTDKGFVYVTADVRVRFGQTWTELRVTREQVPISTSGSFGPLVGRSEAMRAIYKQLEALAPTKLNVLITGETGTGKELVARALHNASPRSSASFVTIDCGSIPPQLAESVLFGHEKGAFTGADRRSAGLFENANGGTLFLDEIGELSLDIQPKLLRALQAREIRSVGGKEYRPIDVRVIAATLRDLHTEVNEGRFRPDLFHRLNTVEVRMPSLRDRLEDIPDMVARFLTEFGDPGAVTRMDEVSRGRLLRYDWPGNVRELHNVIEAAFELSHGGPIEIPELGSRRSRAAGSEAPLRPSLSRPYEAQRKEHTDAFDRAYFSALLRETEGNVSEMARMVDMERSTVRDYLKRLGLRGGK